MKEYINHLHDKVQRLNNKAHRLHNNKAAIFVKKLIGIYSGKRVARSAAELSYFLTLSIFPILICLYTMLGNLMPDVKTLLEFLENIFPVETLDIISEYVGYVSINTSAAMLTGGLVLMATSSAAAFRSLHNIMGDIQGGTRFSGILSLVFSFLFSLVFLGVIYFSVIVLVTGNRFIGFVSEYVDFLHIDAAWVWIRFVLLFMLLLAILYGLYRITAPRGKEKKLLPGAFLATTALVGVSILFSWFIGRSSRSLVYGSLASIIILMFWLYVCGTIIIMGSAVNAVLREMRGRGKGYKYREPKKIKKPRPPD